ncbi:hypothetical protein GZ78_15410 [Endozoicomonas numazuensis]|uniref:Uncharacterized protein n=1 Tax=Endozoicomonas numazuensis TaxID=1137799 RepID=A0A081NFJ5_9GAMM|nr:hypothetical protein GZ78_15410 [Endozoicomonas numazuensis]
MQESDDRLQMFTEYRFFGNSVKLIRVSSLQISPFPGFITGRFFLARVIGLSSFPFLASSVWFRR